MRVKLRDARLSMKLSPDEIAKMVSVKLDTWYKYESGVRTPTMKRAKHIASILDCTLEDIFFDDQTDKKSKNNLSIGQTDQGPAA